MWLRATQAMYPWVQIESWHHQRSSLRSHRLWEISMGRGRGLPRATHPSLTVAHLSNSWPLTSHSLNTRAKCHELQKIAYITERSSDILLGWRRPLPLMILGDWYVFHRFPRFPSLLVGLSNWHKSCPCWFLKLRAKCDKRFTCSTTYDNWKDEVSTWLLLRTWLELLKSSLFALLLLLLH